MSKIKIQVQNSNGQNTYEYEHKYGADDYSDKSTEPPSTPCLDDSLREY